MLDFYCTCSLFHFMLRYNIKYAIALQIYGWNHLFYMLAWREVLGISVGEFNLFSLAFLSILSINVT